MNRSILNTGILLLALVATPLMAQDDNPTETEPTATKTNRDRARGDRWLEQIRIELERWGGGLSEEDLKRLKDAIKTHTPKQANLTEKNASGSFLLLRGGQDSETMQGSWNDADGSQGKYTLTSLGKGRYKLVARNVGKDGATTEYKDEGTLVELKKKYSFLKQFLSIRILEPSRNRMGAFTLPPLTPWPWAVSVNKQPDIRFVPALGVTVRRPSKELEYHLKLPTETTWIVDKVLPNAKHGLRKLDLLTGADDKDLAEFKTLKDAKRVLVVIRRGTALRIALNTKPAK